MMPNVGLIDLIQILPLIVLFLSSLIPITIKVLRGNKEQSAEAVLLQGMGGLLCSLIVLLTTRVWMSDSQAAPAFLGALTMDGVTFWTSIIALVAAGISLIMMYDNPSTSGDQFSELVFLTLSSVLGMLILAAATDLIVVFIGLEMMSLSLYLMIAMSHEQRLAKEAAFKYFVLGSFASAIFLYGVSFIYGTVGNTHIPEIIAQTGSLISGNRLFLFGIILVILGFCFKVSIAPFHAWTPDVYQGAPTPHSGLMATAVKATCFAAFLRIISSHSLVGSENLLNLLQWLAVLTMLIGNLAAIVQSNFKRMLAYSSIAHSGYLLVGVITAGVADKAAFGNAGVIFYLVGYSLMTLGAFAIASLTEKTEQSSLQIEDLAGFAKKRPLMALCLTVFLLSLAGIPPTIGFFGKFYLFASAIGEGLIWLAVWGVLNSVISVYYYLRPIVLMYMQEGTELNHLQGMQATRLTIIASAVVVILLGIFSGPLFTAVELAM
jgi:NADH-quinone oxidoreductase subunit N